MGRLSDVSKIIYDVQAPEMFKQDSPGYKQPSNYWKCYRISNSSPMELLMLNKDSSSRSKHLVNKVELGSYNTELLYNYLEPRIDIPLYAPQETKKNTRIDSTPSKNWTGPMVYVEEIIDGNQSREDQLKEIDQFDLFCKEIKKEGNKYTYTKVYVENKKKEIKSLKTLENEAKAIKPEVKEESTSKVDIGYFEQSVQLSEDNSDSLRVRTVYSSTFDKTYFVTVATNQVSTLKIFNQNLQEIYCRVFESDIYIVDFELMYNH